MDVEADKRPAVLALAERFETKRFLPTCADISNFCTIYGIDPPASKSRAAAIPRLFKYFAAMDTKDVERLSADKAYSGPSELGPLAEAIRWHGRAVRNLGPDSPRGDEGASVDMREADRYQPDVRRQRSPSSSLRRSADAFRLGDSISTLAALRMRALTRSSSSSSSTFT